MRREKEEKANLFTRDKGLYCLRSSNVPLSQVG